MTIELTPSQQAEARAKSIVKVIEIMIAPVEARRDVRGRISTCGGLSARQHDRTRRQSMGGDVQHQSW
jgi:hypothetical protein